MFPLLSGTLWYLGACFVFKQQNKNGLDCISLLCMWLRIATLLCLSLSFFNCGCIVDFFCGKKMKSVSAYIYMCKRPKKQWCCKIAHESLCKISFKRHALVLLSGLLIRAAFNSFRFAVLVQPSSASLAFKKLSQGKIHKVSCSAS